MTGKTYEGTAGGVEEATGGREEGAGGHAQVPTPLRHTSLFLHSTHPTTAAVTASPATTHEGSIQLMCFMLKAFIQERRARDRERGSWCQYLRLARD